MIISAEEFMLLRISAKPEEYMRAGMDDAPDSVWMELIERYPDMRIWVARNHTIPRGIQRILALDPDDRVREGIARRDPLDYDLYVWMSHDSSEKVREHIVMNRKVPLEVLESMAANDPVERLRVLASVQIKARAGREEAHA